MCAPAEGRGRRAPHAALRRAREGAVNSRDGGRENPEGRPGHTSGAAAVGAGYGMRERAAGKRPVPASPGRNGTVA